MKWFADWWGTEISADSKDDEALLKQLLDKLPKKADKYYVKGEISISDSPQNEFIKHEGFTITFDR